MTLPQSTGVFPGRWDELSCSQGWSSSSRDQCHTQTHTLVPVLAPQNNPAPFSDPLSLTVLQLRLQQRRTREQLADQGIMPREYLLLPFSPWLRGLCSSWHCWGTVWHQLPAWTPQLRASRGLQERDDPRCCTVHLSHRLPRPCSD